MQLGQWDQAISDLRTVIIAGRAKSWRGAANHFDLAMLLAYRGDQAGSRESLRQFVASGAQISTNSTALACLMTRDSPSDHRAFVLRLQAPRAIALPTGFHEQFDLSLMRMGLSDGIAHLMSGQPLLAISCFESQLNISPSFRRVGSENESRVRICLAIALLSVGDTDRADAMLREAEEKLDPIPTSIAAVADHVLLIQARADLAVTK